MRRGKTGVTDWPRFRIRTGTGDLLALGESLGAVSDWNGVADAKQDLFVGDFGMRFADGSLADLDGDGAAELVLGQWGLAGGSGPAIARKNADGAWGEPVSVAGDVPGEPFDTLVLDFDEDGVPDAYMCHHRGVALGPNTFWRGDGEGGLVEATPPGAAIQDACMSVSAADLNGDERLDLLLAVGSGPILLLADATGYVDATNAWGLPGTDGEQMTWGSALGDLDNDGLFDAIVTTSDFTGLDTGIWPAWAFRQVEAGRFEEIGEDLGLPPVGGTRSVLVHDINADGVLDILMSDIHRGPWLFESRGCGAAAWLEVEAPEGTVVTVHSEGRTWTQPVTLPRGIHPRGGGEPSENGIGSG